VGEAVVTASVTEDEMRAHFEANRAQYDQPPQINIAHMLFRIDEKGHEAAAQAKVRIVQARLADGASFEELAMKYSDDAESAAQGGSLGYVNKGTLAEEFEDVAWALKPGQIGGPVRTLYGLHLIKAYGVKPAQKADYDQVKVRVREHALQSKRKKAFDAWLDEQWKAAEIERFNRP
jgi:foldase protein PrsA